MDFIPGDNDYIGTNHVHCRKCGVAVEVQFQYTVVDEPYPIGSHAEAIGFITPEHECNDDLLALMSHHHGVS